MFCGKCGKEIGAGMKFCPQCGWKVPEDKRESTEKVEPAKVEPEKVEPAKVESEKVEPAKAESEKPKPEKPPVLKSAPSRPSPPNGSSKKKLLIAAGGAAAILILGLVAKNVFFSKLKLNAADYVTLTTDGIDGHGTAVAGFDVDALLKDVRKEKDLTPRAEELIRTQLEDAHKDVILSEASELSNGDKVTASSKLDEKILNQLDIRLENSEREFEVADLILPGEIRLANYLALDLDGFDGYGRASLAFDRSGVVKAIQDRIAEVEPELKEEEVQKVYQEEFAKTLDNISFEYEPLNQLANGDKPEIAIKVDQAEFEEYGLSLITDSPEFQVEGLPPVEEIDYQDYLTVTFDGYDGAGSWYSRIDEEKLSADLAELFQKDQRGLYGREIYGQTTADDAEDAAYRLVSYWNNNYKVRDRESSQSYANGDKLTLTCAWEDPYAEDDWEADSEETSEETSEDNKDKRSDTVMLEDIGIRLNSGFEYETEVAGLKEPEEVDLAEAISVTFSGTCPDVYANVEVDYDKYPFMYNTSAYEDLYSQSITAENGDKFEGKLTYDAQDMLENGYVVVNDTYSFPVEGLQTYTLGTDPADYAEIAKSAVREAENYLASDSEYILRSVGLDDLFVQWDQIQTSAVEAEYALTGPDSWEDGNRLFIVTQTVLPVKNYARQEQTENVWIAAYTDDLVKNADGSISRPEYWNTFYAGSQSQLQEQIDEEFDYDFEGSEIVATALEAEAEAESEAETEEVIKGSEEEAAAVVSATEKTYAPAEIDETALKQATSDPITVAGHTYVRFDQIDGKLLSWKEAEAWCEAAGGHLVTVTDAREQRIVKYLALNGESSNYWLGGTDEGQEGAWRWVTGEAFTYNGWDDGQPDNYPQSRDSGYEYENYLETYSSSKWWNDRTNDFSEDGFILEAESPDLTGTEEPGTLLGNLTPSYKSNVETWDQMQDPYGGMHFFSTALDADYFGTLEYDLNGTKKMLQMTVSTDEDAGTDAHMDLAVWGDDRLLYSVYDYQRSDAPQYVTIDLTGVQRLSIQTCNRGNSGNAWMVLSDAIVTDAEDPVTQSTITRLADVWAMSGHDYEADQRRAIQGDAYGEIHRDVVTFHAGREATEALALNGQYDTFHALLIPNTYSHSAKTAVNVSILADGREVWSKDGHEVHQGSLPISVDVKGVQVLEIRTAPTDSENGYDATAMLADAYFTEAGTLEETTEGDEDMIEIANVEVVNYPADFPKLKAEYADQAAEVLTNGWHRYYRFDLPMTMEEAQEFCQKAGGRLAQEVEPEEGSAWATPSQRSLEILKEDGVYNIYWTEATVQEQKQKITDYKSDKNTDAAKEAEDMETGFILEVLAYNIPEEGKLTSMNDLAWSESENAGWLETIRYYLGEEYRLGVNGFNISTGGYVRTRLEGAYERMTGTAVLDGNADVNGRTRVAVFGDGRLLWEKILTKADDAVEFDVDVTGVKTLSLGTYQAKGDSTSVYFPDTTFYPSANTVDLRKGSRLTDFQQIDMSEGEVQWDGYPDAYGIMHDGRLVLDAVNDGYALYNLSGICTRFSGKITAGAFETMAGTIHVKIYADDQLVQEADFDSLTGMIDIDADVTGARTLKIEASQETENGGSSWVSIADDWLE